MEFVFLILEFQIYDFFPCTRLFSSGRHIALKEVISIELFSQIVELLPAIWAGSTKTFETTFQDKIYLNTLQPIKNESELVESFVLVASDITERKKNELKIIDQNKALKEIAWHQSHPQLRGSAS